MKRSGVERGSEGFKCGGKGRWVKEEGGEREGSEWGPRVGGMRVD